VVDGSGILKIAAPDKVQKVRHSVEAFETGAGLADSVMNVRDVQELTHIISGENKEVVMFTKVRQSDACGTFHLARQDGLDTQGYEGDH
jgi:hypothetical protein